MARKPVLYEKLAAACGVDRDEAVPLLVEVLRFVSMAARAKQAVGGPLTPSPMVDDAWHELILCTREYAALCEEQFGRFVHHDPGGDEATNRNQFRETMRLYNLWFGPPPPKYWGPQPRDAVQANCGACSSAISPSANE